MALILTDEQQVRLSVSAQTVHGHPARIDGAPVWSSSDSTILDVAVDVVDPTIALAVAKGLGVAQISVSADADLGTGVRTIVGTLDVEVVAAEAATLGIAAATPESQP